MVVFLQRHRGSDGEVREDAEALAAVAKGMVGTPGKMPRDGRRLSGAAHRPGGGDGAADRGKRASHPLGPGREPDASVLLCGEPTV